MECQLQSMSRLGHAACRAGTWKPRGATHQSADKAIVQAFVSVRLDDVRETLPVALPSTGHVCPQGL